MFIGVRLSRNAGVTLRYHDKKIAKGAARLIHAENFLQATNKLTIRVMLDRFKLLNSLNHQTMGKMVQTVLSFSENHSVTDDKLVAISKRFSESVGLQDQPYLVYRHEDTRHKHVHIVSNIIKPDGKKIDIYTIIKQRSEQIRDQLEKEFDVAEKKEVKVETQKTSAKKLNYGKDKMYEEIVKVLNKVINEYNFTNLDEYNAILHGYNVSVQSIANAKGSKRTGLMYRALDDSGNPIGKIMTASSLENKPTWKRLQGRFVENAGVREEKHKDLGNRVKWVLFQKPNDRHELSEGLMKERIQLEVIQAKGGIDDQPVLVDHHSRIAVRADDLDRNEEILALVQKKGGLAMDGEEQKLDIKAVHQIKRHG